MVNEIKYVSIMQIWDRCLQHPLMQDLTLEQVIQYVTAFNGIFNFSNLYLNKYEIINIEDYRAKLPCDLIAIVQVKDCKTGQCIKTMSSTFMNDTELTFKTQNSVIYTNVPECELEICYKAIPVDDEGLPMIIDNERYMNALYEYIKSKQFTILFEMGKLNANVLQNVQQEYAWAAGQLQEEMNTPSLSEMEAISNAHNNLLLDNRRFGDGFNTLGEERYLNVH